MTDLKPWQAGTDRRRARRRSAMHDHGIVSIRVRPGGEVSLLDVSAGGALVETTYRLLPGSAIELRVATHERRASVRGWVLRSAVVTLHAAGVCYRSAIGFEHLLPWLMDDEANGYGVPSSETHMEDACRVNATQEAL